MYKNLMKLTKEKNITYSQIAIVLGYKYTTISDKVKCVTNSGFTVDEAFTIRNVFFPEYTLEYLFYRENMESSTSGK